MRLLQSTGLIFAVAHVVTAWNPFSTECAHKDAKQEIPEYFHQFVDTLSSALRDSANTARHTYERSRPMMDEVISTGQAFLSDKFTDFNILSREKEYFIYVDVPGMTKDEVHLFSDDYRIHVKGAHDCPKKHSVLPWIEDPETCIERNIDVSMVIPRDADAHHMQSMFSEGVLKIRLPRNNKGLQKRTFQEKWQEFADSITDTIKENAENLKENIVGMGENTKETVSGAVGIGKHAAEHVAKEGLKKTEESLDNAKDHVAQVRKEL